MAGSPEQQYGHEALGQAPKSLDQQSRAEIQDAIARIEAQIGESNPDMVQKLRDELQVSLDNTDKFAKFSTNDAAMRYSLSTYTESLNKVDEAQNDLKRPTGTSEFTDGELRVARDFLHRSNVQKELHDIFGTQQSPDSFTSLA